MEGKEEEEKGREGKRGRRKKVSKMFETSLVNRKENIDVILRCQSDKQTDVVASIF